MLPVPGIGAEGMGRRGARLSLAQRSVGVFYMKPS